MISVGVIIPSRGTERVNFLRNAIRMLTSQTVEVKHIEVSAGAPESDKCDITYRYRNAYQKFDPAEVDIICFWEDDDWYAPNYLEAMLKKWEDFGRPDLFGINYTIYYHLKLKKYFTFDHVQRSSSMSTFIKPGMDFTWPRDEDPYTDQWLWMNPCGIKTKIVFKPEKILCVGMKHGQGMVGGRFHDDKLHRYIHEDNGFLKETLDPVSYKFYSAF